ncbi:MAG: hypothetical protein KIT48_04805 [Pseudolabrys sp.]|nr:hypothetical protein [Pseudolabrys sp.]
MTRANRVCVTTIMVAAALFAAETSVSQNSLDEDGVPVVIARSVAKQIRTCKGDISSLPTSLFSLDLNGDGRLDYVVNFENFDCEAVPSPYCGTGGCLHEIWLSNNEGWNLALSPQANLIAGADMIDGKPALRLLVHHRYCETQPCYQNIVWSGEKLSVVAR